MSKTATVDQGATRPLQVIPWKQKDDKWFRANIDDRIKSAGVGQPMAATDATKDMDLLYDVYNNRFPMEWFKHITDPLSAKKSQHKAFPAKIRPTGILRPNIDLLLGEYPRRPFIYNVANLGETGHNRFMEGMQQKAHETLTQHFIQAALEEAQAQGQELSEEQLAQLQQEPPVPEQVKAEYESSFKDLITIKAQKFLKRIIREQEIRRKFQKEFKHWLIAGTVASYKAIEHDEIVYRDISPKQLRWDKSSCEEFIEDGEWVVYLEWLTVSDVVTRHYEDLKADDIRNLDRKDMYQSPQGFYDHLDRLSAGGENGGKIPVYHVQWKGKKKIGFLSYVDPETMQLVEDTVDENYIPDEEAGEKVEWRWVNEVYEGWRIGEDIYVKMRPLPVQRSEMNNFSTCKLSYNGRNYSDLHSENISVLQIGIPFQIMFVIIGYIIEKTIAKSKGKILLIDQKALPNHGEWDEEKAFYYAEGLGYMLLDRSQPGVDKSWNQYQVVDMSLFEQLKQLIELQQHTKQEWDDALGISRQRKGQTYASDGQGVTERSVFQSTVITDMIFAGFEEFTQRELQGLMDLSKFVTAKGIRGSWNGDDMTTEIFEIFPEDFMNEEIGVFVMSASEEMQRLSQMKAQIQAMIQNDHKASTVLETILSDNTAELMQKLKHIEAIDAQIQEQTANSEHEKELAIEQSRKDFMEFQELLKRETLLEEYQEKQDLETLKISLQASLQPEAAPGTESTMDPATAEKLAQSRLKIQLDAQNKTEDRKVKLQALELQKKGLEQQDKQNKVTNQHTKEKLSIQRKAANKKPAAPKKK